MHKKNTIMETKEKILENVKRYFVSCEISIDGVDQDSNLYNDLCLRKAEFEDFVLFLEQRYSIIIPVKTIRKWETLGDVINTVRSLSL